MKDPRSKEFSSGTESSDTVAELQASTVDYDIVALSMPIYYNREGDHDHNGMLFVLEANVPILEYIEALARQGSRRRPGVQTPNLQTLFAAAAPRSQDIEVHLPVTPEQARRPHPLVRPLVLRARLGDTVKVTFRNQIRDRDVGMHLVSGGYDVETSDGSHVGANPATLAGFGSTQIYTWSCEHEGVFPFHDGGNFDGGEDGTNVHGLFGALIVEPRGTTWRDPVTGRASHGDTGTDTTHQQLDGLHLDVLPLVWRPRTCRRRRQRWWTTSGLHLRKTWISRKRSTASS